jgi:CRP-like cAMP-binding protein
MCCMAPLVGSYAAALSPCFLCLISWDDVRHLLLGDPRVALRITETMGRRLLQARRRLSDFAFKSQRLRPGLPTYSILWGLVYYRGKSRWW